MKKRVCEHCRYFVEAGIAKNGWCVHPRRKTSSDIRLIVRRGELNCRNGWSQDLFEPMRDDPSADVLLFEHNQARPERPASLDEVAAAAQARTTLPPPTPSAPAVDVVVGEAPAAPLRAEGPTGSGADPRSAVLRARERVRARQIEERRRDGRSYILPAPAPSEDRAVRSPSVPSRRSLDIPPVPREEVVRAKGADLGPLLPPIASTAADDERFRSIPDRDETIELPRTDRLSVTLPIPIERTTAADLVLEPPQYEAPMAPRETHHDDAVIVHRERTALDPQRLRKPAEPAWRKWLVRPPASPVVSFAEVGAPPALEPEAERREFADQPWDDLEAGVVDRDGEAAAMEPSEPEFDLFDVLEPIDDVEIAPHLVRSCRTCRDFRPAEGGDRGWCANTWAFAHTRTVDADDLPCASTVGMWWLPHDDVWLEAADVSAHGQPTPLFDYWREELARANGTAVAAVPERRRRRS